MAEQEWDGAVLEAGRTVEEAEDFLGTGGDGKFAGLLGVGKGRLEGPSPLEGDLVEEAQGRDRDRDRAGRRLLIVVSLLKRRPPEHKEYSLLSRWMPRMTTRKPDGFLKRSADRQYLDRIPYSRAGR